MQSVVNAQFAKPILSVACLGALKCRKKIMWGVFCMMHISWTFCGANESYKCCCWFVVLCLWVGVIVAVRCHSFGSCVDQWIVTQWISGSVCRWWFRLWSCWLAVASLWNLEKSSWAFKGFVLLLKTLSILHRSSLCAFCHRPLLTLTFGLANSLCCVFAVTWVKFWMRGSKTVR